MNFKSSIATLLLATVIPTIAGSIALAQVADRNLPSRTYYTGILSVYSADYEDALRHFEREASGAFKFGTERFMDSACYWTMAGECHYHMGNYGQALGYYEKALDLLSYYSQGDWIDRFPRDQFSQIQRNNAADQIANVTWHRSNRGQSVARVPSRFTMLFGRLDANRVLVEGGTLQKPELRGVDHAEIMRCCALAIYRRYMIKGVTSHIDPFTAKLVAATNRIPSGVPVIGKWNLMLRGLANMSAGRNARAVTNIRDALQFAGGLDHNLTPLGLLALAQITYIEGDSKSAIQLALEASYSAALFRQFDLIEESLSLGSRIHLSENASVFPPLAAAVDWASRSKARKFHTSMLVRLADCLVESDSMDQAKATLKQTKRAMSRTDLNGSPITGQIQYLDAAIKFYETGDGFNELQRALTQYQQHSLWLFRLQLVTNAFAAGGISQKQAEAMYAAMLIDPTDKNWRTDPLETTTYMATPHTAQMEQWYELLVARKNHDKAIDVAERVRRHRFYESLPMSGRLLSLRWMLTAPMQLLSKNAQAQRSAFYARYPEMKKAVESVDSLRGRLRQLPLKPDEDTPAQKQQRDLFVEMLKASEFQESVIAGVALRRQAADFVFPQIADYTRISDSLKDHQVMITSIQTASGYHQYVITNKTRRYLGVVRERDMRRAVAELFKKLGINDAVNTIDSATLNSSEWKEASLKLKKMLFANLDDDQWANYKEAIIVPDGLLWYVPFEILQIGDDVKDSKNLNDLVKFRYLPMASMSIDTKRTPATESRVAVVTGKIHPKADLSLTAKGFEDLSDSITNAVQYDRAVKIPSNLTSTVTDAMLIWQDLKTTPKDGPMSLSPFYADKGRPGSQISDWMTAPWYCTEKILLPAFTSNGAAGVKSRSDGADLFFTTTALMASGVRSVMISRWNPGGKNAIELSRKFMEELQKTSNIEALDTASRFARDQEIKFEAEIRVKPPRKDPKPFKAEHPFFWAQNLLVDIESLPLPATDDDGDAADAAGAGDDVAADDEDKDGDAGADDKDDPAKASAKADAAEANADDADMAKPDSDGAKKDVADESSENNTEEAEPQGTTEEGSGTNEGSGAKSI